MFECAIILLNQLISLIPTFIAVYFVFDLVGALLFNKR